jgi:hypothetical protein
MVIKYIDANSLTFAYAEEGEGPLVMMLHGFPDIATTWSQQIPALVAQGYRVITPYLRGYPPTDVPSAGFYDKATLTADIVALVNLLGSNKPVHFVGHDWGAIIGYAVLASHPELISRAVLMSVPHPDQVAQSLIDPKQIHRSFHWWFFQMPELPEKALFENDMAFIDYLWSYWSTKGYRDEDHIRDVKNTLKQPGVLKATLGYYRAMFDTSKGDPSLGKLRDSISQPINVPTLVLCGAEDLRAEYMKEQARYFTSEYDYQLVEQAGHFVHREQPEQVNRLILEWLKK